MNESDVALSAAQYNRIESILREMARRTAREREVIADAQGPIAE